MKKILKAAGILGLTGLIVIFLDVGCVFRYTTGFPCPGCGTTRAWVSFLQGHLVEAFYWHPLFWLTVPLVLLAMIKQQNVFKNKTLNKIFWITIAAMYLTVYVVRLVLLFPDTPPLDYNEHSLLFQAYEFVRDKLWPW